jgi:hypothetical protein
VRAGAPHVASGMVISTEVDPRFHPSKAFSILQAAGSMQLVP